jgi:hypothetical protein
MATATRQAVLCEWCKKPLRRNSTDGLNITYGDINAAEQRGMEIERREVESRNRPLKARPLSGDPIEFPHWRWEHLSCTEGEGYFIAMNRIRDSSMAMAWTVHLMEKTWLRYTEWESAMRRGGLVGSTN